MIVRPVWWPPLYWSDKDAAQPLAPADCSLGGFVASVAAAELGAVSQHVAT